MPIGYLISVGLAAVLTGAAVAPIRRSWTLGRLSWRLGMQVNELPVYLAVWVLAATGLAATQGELATPVGIVGLAVAAATLIGLAMVLRRGVLARPAAERALTEGLGPEWRAELPPGLARRLARPRPWWRLLITPLAVRRRDVVRETHSYGPAGRANRLDVYRARSGATTGPCLVHFHGGGYRSGRKSREARALLYRLAGQGWLCVSANYRLAPAAAYPAQLVDAKRVIAWLRANAGSYGADASTVVVAGSSAGAYLAATTALTPNQAALQPGFEDVDTAVTAAICLYGFYGPPAWIERDAGAPCAPIELVDATAPPMFLAHGRHDSFVGVEQARELADHYRKVASDRLVYLELPGGQHTFDLYNSVRFHAVVEAVEVFAAAVTAAQSNARRCLGRGQPAGS